MLKQKNSVVLGRILVVLAVMTPWTLAAATEQVLHAFSGTSAGPSSNLVFDAQGNLYGVTASGYGACSGSCGTVFKLSPSANGWTFTSLYTFTGGNDGAYPQAPLTIDANGNLYGTTPLGGGSCPLQSTAGCGTVFRISPNGSGGWTETVLHRFTKTSDGAVPVVGVVFDQSGNLYGTTQFSGATHACPQGCGTIYKLTQNGSSWTFSVVHTFNSTGGSFGGVIFFDREGNMFGTTGGGGIVNRACGSGCGVVFEMTPSDSTWTETVLYKFTGASDGWDPFPLTMDVDGNLFGTTLFGGSSPCKPNGCGTAFKLTPSGSTYSFKTIHNFTGSDGQIPVGIVADANDNVFGTTETTGTANSCSGACGTVFRLADGSGGKWTETILHRFSGGNDGSTPFGGVIMDSAGNLYGTTATGGTSNQGVAFKIIQ